MLRNGHLRYWFLMAAGIGFFTILPKAYGFNLISDIDQNTQWTLGSAVQAGTSLSLVNSSAYNIKAGQFNGSALASVANYRFLNFAAGGTAIPQANGSTKLLDTGKIGINVGYFLKNMVNQPPALIQNMVIGPTLMTTLVTTPHVFVPGFDFNYSFGAPPASLK